MDIVKVSEKNQKNIFVQKNGNVRCHEKQERITVYKAANGEPTKSILPKPK